MTNQPDNQSIFAVIMASLQMLLSTFFFVIYFFHIFRYLHVSWSPIEVAMVAVYVICTFPAGLIWMHIHFRAIESPHFATICLLGGALSVGANGAFWFYSFRRLAVKVSARYLNQ
jgi:hypothetical protein